MLMQKSCRSAHSDGNAYTRQAQDYPFVVRAMDAGFAAYAAISRAFKRWRSRQLLAALDRDQLRDIGLSRSDVWSGRLGEILARQEKADRTCATRTEGRPVSLDNASLCARALAKLRDDQLHNLSEAGLKARREARRGAPYC